MKFNLNEMGSGTNSVFNNGIAGKVENVKVEVTKKKGDEADNNPDYRLVFTDSNGLTINQGFFYHKENSAYTEKKNQDNAMYLINRIVSAAKAVVPEGFEFPDVSDKSVNEIVDILFKIIKEFSDDAKVNVFATYGTSDRPSRFLNLRFFDFVENANVKEKSKLVPKGIDLMTRPVEDAPREQSDSTSKNEADNW